MRVGIDIIKIDRFKNLTNKTFFTKEELNYIEKKGVKKFETMAGIFCAKEAFVKALKCGLGNGDILKKIVISHDKNNAPFVNLNEEIKQMLFAKNLSKVEISISHTDEIAEAICIIF